MQKDIPRKEFLETQSFQRLFLGGYLFALVEYLCKHNLKIKTKNIKNYSAILAITNHRNWLDDLPPLIASKRRIEQLKIFDWLSMLKIYFFEMAVNTCEM